MKGFDRLDMTPTRMLSPTRISSVFQDTYVDFFVVSDASKIDRVEVGRKISDHCFCLCVLSFCASIGNARRIFDFRRTIQNPQSMMSLSAYFDAIDFVDQFTGLHLDDLPVILNELILDGWIAHGVSKVVNEKSRPWFAPIVKFHRRNSRFWARRLAEMKIQGTQFTVVEDRIYSMAQVKAQCDRESLHYHETENDIVRNCEQYCNRMLEENCHDALRRIYQVRPRYYLREPQ